MPTLGRGAASRRAVLGALAAAAALLPAAAAHAADAIAAGPRAGEVPSASAEDHPDRELIAMGRRYAELKALEEAADKQYAALYEAYERREPKPSDALRHRITDHLGGLQLPIIGTCRTGLSADPRRNDLYTEEEVERLRSSPSNPFNAPGDRKARIEEIEQEWERWDAECSALAESTGVYAVQDEREETVAEMRSLAKRIAATPAKTIDGLRVRASILAGILCHFEEYEEEDMCTDELMYRSIVRDLLAMTA